MLVAGGSNIGDALRELAAEHGFEFDEAGTAVIDHHNYDQTLDSGDHTTIVVTKNQLLNAELIVGNTAKLNPVLFKGVALVAGKSNNLALKIVTAAGTAYSYDPKAARVVVSIHRKNRRTFVIPEPLHCWFPSSPHRRSPVSQQRQNRLCWQCGLLLKCLFYR